MKQDVAPIDLYTLVHFLYGYLAREYNWSREDIMVGAIMYEFIEPTIIKIMRQNLGIMAWGHESKQNILWDIFIAEIGAVVSDYDRGEL